MHPCLTLVTTLIAVSSLIDASTQDREFKIDYAENSFYKDGQPFQYASGSIHYFRVPPEYWRDRLLKLRAAGFNTLQTYVAWNLHEPYPNQYNFENEADLVEYVSLAQELGLNVILRPGPFIDAEWDMGGLPWWLLKNGSSRIALRTSDPAFVSALERWFGVLLPLVRPLLYQNGGPILTVQVENEYGSYYACDRNYTATVRDLLWQYLSNDTVLFTTDGDSDGCMKCGVVNGVYPTVDFGPTDKKGVENAFAVQRRQTPCGGPLVNSEYYPGWFDKWGGSHAHTDENKTTDTIRYMWNMNASFNMYMFHGGTNFGYWAGAESSPFVTVSTSYDYDAPVSEAGDPTSKWDAVRATMLELTHNENPDPVPLPSAKIAYGKVPLKPIGTILELLPVVAPKEKVVESQYPLSMEQVDHPYGYILYETVIGSKAHTLSFWDVVRDRAHVILDGQLLQIIDREFNSYEIIDISGVSNVNSTLQILVENRGRVCYGKEINDSKGLLGNVTIDDDQVLENWKIYPIDLKRLTESVHRCSREPATIRMCVTNRTKPRKNQDGDFLPTVYAGSVTVTVPPFGDTFLDPDGWSKGQAFVNGRNLGRYWPVRGPQVTLYVPGPFLSHPSSSVMLFELDEPGNCQDDGSCIISFVDKHQL